MARRKKWFGRNYSLGTVTARLPYPTMTLVLNHVVAGGKGFEHLTPVTGSGGLLEYSIFNRSATLRKKKRGYRSEVLHDFAFDVVLLLKFLSPFY